MSKFCIVYYKHRVDRFIAIPVGSILEFHHVSLSVA
jgi:hypothetical protein